MGWLMLVNPPKATNAPWNDLQEIPDPFNFNFFRVLCWEMSGIQLCSITIVENRIERSEEQLLYGFQGNDEIGVGTTEHRSLFSSMFPVEIWQETYGLPGIEVFWEYKWASAGQAGHSIFQHKQLLVQFATPDAQAHFERNWYESFGEIPHFQPTDIPGVTL